MSERKLHRPVSSCPLAVALDVIGDHWTLLVIRDLGLSGAHEYKELFAAMEGISTNILADRLKRLERTGVIGWVRHPTHGRRKLYYLLDKGKRLLETVIELFIWGEESLDGTEMPVELRRSLRRGKDFVLSQIQEDLDRWESENLPDRNAASSTRQQRGGRRARVVLGAGGTIGID